MVSTPTRPAAARIPTCRMPPPSCLRTRRASSMRARDETRTDPAGAQRPFDRVTIAVSAPATRAARRDAEDDGGVPQPRAVDVDGHAGLVGGGDGAAP